jgi:hypothetical protein
MTKLKWILPLLCIAVFLGGCPYSSQMAIDTPSVKVEPTLLGKWEPKSASESVYTVSKQDEFRYRIEKRTKGEKYATDTYVAHISNVGNDKFLNLQEGTEPGKPYYYYKLEINSTSNKLTLNSVTENIDETFTTSTDLKAFFEKHKGFSFFYDKNEEVYFKAD